MASAEFEELVRNATSDKTNVKYQNREFFLKTKEIKTHAFSPLVDKIYYIFEMSYPDDTRINLFVSSTLVNNNLNIVEEIYREIPLYMERNELVAFKTRVVGRLKTFNIPNAVRPCSSNLLKKGFINIWVIDFSEHHGYPDLTDKKAQIQRNIGNLVKKVLF